MDNGKFFGKLFDFSFKEFISLQIVKYLYIIGIVFAGLSALGMIGVGVSDMQYSFLGGLVKVLFSPVFFVLMVLVVRLVLEALVATFRIAENTTKLIEVEERKS
ncbi:hypothetical protein CHL67_02890 [Prosthecochloris sp. GSB1]|uniref:DUF4282 domain-containing protein n=1 Tax=Prosthecochloris sp. GSB1 TaxID=281093 RepID=UPI000B8CDA98|nr:DUF4282 domain-containing protein [Prosthecochloris sp. GSB1]ASQ90010.1 hypothetical protein CHL67_02890 [Prosthecochloris sp. GSB1]